MKSIGKVLKEFRIKKKLSREKLAKLTKIKANFIECIEEEKWESLPDYPVVLGFVKNISKTLGINEKHIVALLRRDYPPKSLPINPKPEIEEKFRWSPRLTFLVGVFVVTIFIVGYLIYQYLNFIKPPKLFLDTPKEGETISTPTLLVKGLTDPEAQILINNQPVTVSEDGNFEAEIEVSEETSEVVVVARSRYGKETVIRRKIKLDIKS